MNHPIKQFCVILLTLLTTMTFAQSDSVRFKMVQSLTKYIKSHYVSASLAKQMSDTISWKFANGKYDSSLNLDEFAFEITKDLRRISNDYHISVTRPQNKPFDEAAYDSKLDKMTPKQQKKYFEKSQKRWKEFSEEYKKRTKDDMFTYGEIKILPGNVGYVEIKDFGSTSYNKKKNKGRIRIEAVMSFFKSANSIIIDLRDNQGGFIDQALKFCSFFSSVPNNYFISTEWHIRYDSSGAEKEITYSDKKMTSDKINNSLTKAKKIYILTSRRTFSAAELTAYKIKQYNPSALIVGEKTIGGGNGHSGGTNDKYFFAVIPNLIVFDESNANFSLEAKGVLPDIATTEDSAFVTAYKLAAKKGFNSSDSKIKFYRKAKKSANESLQYSKTNCFSDESHCVDLCRVDSESILAETRLRNKFNSAFVLIFIISNFIGLRLRAEHYKIQAQQQA